MTTTRPPTVTDEHLEYLDALRESGAVNMFGAAPHLAREFGLPTREARHVLTYWMESFGQRQAESSITETR